VSPAVNLELVETIRRVRFTPVRLREGYAMDAVDQLLDRLEQAAAQGAGLQALAEQAGLRTSRWREGYDRVEVDRFLLEITAASSLGTTTQGSQPTVTEGK
jgi:DivIVA domain-containing protein